MNSLRVTVGECEYTIDGDTAEDVVKIYRALNTSDASVQPSHVKPPFTIEEGKFYKRRDGVKVGSMIKAKPYIGMEYFYYDGHDKMQSSVWPNGRRLLGEKETPLDLVAEWTDADDGWIDADDGWIENTGTRPNILAGAMIEVELVNDKTIKKDSHNFDWSLGNIWSIRRWRYVA